jgi:polar amino acid transport system permease protein
MSTDAKSVTIAVVSTIVFLVAAALVVVNSPGWDEVRRFFFDGERFRESFPRIAEAFLINVKLFCLAEVFILAAGLFLAVLRSLPGPVFFPLRALAVVYTDVFRGIPTILVIAMLGFGIPALAIQGAPRSTFFWAVVALVLVYSAYVAEVYRAGIQSVHPSQEAAARSLGLSRRQTLRFVVIPQAVRRVIPPLLNDFIGLQKDTALVAILGTVEAFRRAQIDTAATFNYTAYTATAIVFILFTIPLARLTDWLIERDRRRQLSGRAA